MAIARQLPLLNLPTPAGLPPDTSTEHGEIFTRRWVVDLILDLVGYSVDADLISRRLVEPSCGTGAFLLPIVDRLVESARRRGHDLATAYRAIRAFDLLAPNADRARKAVALRLQEHGVDARSAHELADAWVITGDFLLADHEPASIDFVVGNPPYVRLENMRSDIMRDYRRRCTTMRGRSDLYVGFIEIGLGLLKPGGALGFICADRWMRNQYGADLRALVSGFYAVEAVIAMHDTDAFEDAVSAYPAVIVIRHQAQGRAVVAEANASFEGSDAGRLSRWIGASASQSLITSSVEASKIDHWFEGRDLWPAGSPSQLARIADLERRFPPLVDPATGTRVGIGVATGCDELFITDDPHLVESDRLLPLLRAGDISAGVPDWSGNYLVNPWNGDGLVDLDRYPRLSRYYREHQDRLSDRHIARKRPDQWYRTIDKVHSTLLGRPKLLLPDMKAASHPVLDEGRYYPHHNLYFVVSDEWDLEVLGGLLLSDVANLFVGAYCVKMRGGTFRFQAQYLRRIRVPRLDRVNPEIAGELKTAFRDRDRPRASRVANKVYGIAEA